MVYQENINLPSFSAQICSLEFDWKSTRLPSGLLRKHSFFFFIRLDSRELSSSFAWKWLIQKCHLEQIKIKRWEIVPFRHIEPANTGGLPICLRDCVIGPFFLRECVITKKICVNSWNNFHVWCVKSIKFVKNIFSCVITLNDPFSTQFFRYCVKTQIFRSSYRESVKAWLRDWVPPGGLIQYHMFYTRICLYSIHPESFFEFSTILLKDNHKKQRSICITFFYKTQYCVNYILLQRGRDRGVRFRTYIKKAD